MDEDLIWQVKLHPELYNAQHENFQNTNIRQGAWTSIAKHCNSTSHVARVRWFKLEENFREMIIAIRNGQPHTRPPYYRQLIFLAPFIHAEEDILAGKTTGFAEKSSLTDPLTDFFLSMGKIVEKFDKKRQMKIKDKVSQLVRNAEMETVYNTFSLPIKLLLCSIFCYVVSYFLNIALH